MEFYFVYLLMPSAILLVFQPTIFVATAETASGIICDPQGLTAMIGIPCCTTLSNSYCIHSRHVAYIPEMTTTQCTEEIFLYIAALPHIHPHAFRHTVASILISSGIDPVTTANELGHADANTTNAIYAHQIARARAEASGVRAGVFSILREA